MASRAATATRGISSIGNRRRGEQGFALYELILALAILGLIAAVVIPRVARAPGPLELRTKAEAIAALLRSDRNAALQNGRDVVSLIDVQKGIIASGARSDWVQVPRGAKIELVQSSREARAEGGGIRFRSGGRSSGGAVILKLDSAATRCRSIG
jgi:general secretion pathway protein H